jgi:hypothetical protein
VLGLKRGVQWYQYRRMSLVFWCQETTVSSMCWRTNTTSLLDILKEIIWIHQAACQWAHIQVKLHPKYSSLSKGFDNYVLKGLLANCMIRHGLGVTQIANHSVLIFLLLLDISSDYKIPFLLASINIWTCDLSSIFGLKW